MPKNARKQIMIGGEPVVEIDFKTLHPAILYAEAGAELPEDSYSLEGWPRALVKVALLVLINASTRPKARAALAQHDAMAAVAPKGSQEAYAAADRLIEDVKRMHRPIARFFHSDKGAELMSIDAEMAEAVMGIMMMAGIVVLPVHDSFLVQRSQADKLEETMQRVAYEMGYEALQTAYA